MKLYSSFDCFLKMLFEVLAGDFPLSMPILPHAMTFTLHGIYAFS